MTSPGESMPRLRTWERDWLLLINKRAAIKEQFPSLAKVMRERPGSVTDRAAQELHREQNKTAAAAHGRSAVRQAQDRRAVEADADRFIAEARERAAQRLRDRAAAWRARQDHEETRTA